mmetsp:Transcript_24343/g.74225  ORF Transcript_24343/g.74225 Transcript_24343/m.74225 type:complete len:196 (+) Transcript_24343:74-661(+)
MNVVIPANLKPGDTFEVSVPVAIPTVAAIPAAPPPPRTPITEAEALCYNLRHSVMCYAILDACLAFLNIFLAYVFWWVNLILLVGPLCGWLGAKDWNPPLVNIYAVTSILWFFFAVALFGWFLYLGITDKWRRYFVSDVTPGWFWFSVFWQALWALVRLLIANIVGKFAQLLQSIGRQRMSEVEQQGRRAVLVYY